MLGIELTFNNLKVYFIFFFVSVCLSDTHFAHSFLSHLVL